MSVHHFRCCYLIMLFIYDVTVNTPARHPQRGKMANQGDSRLLRLSEESLTREPEDVFTLHDKIGEGAYGAVYKAVHKESGQLLAIKQVPVDSDLQEIIKEISIMQQCDR